jgi:hypothetical protein
MFFHNLNCKKEKKIVEEFSSEKVSEFSSQNFDGKAFYVVAMEENGSSSKFANNHSFQHCDCGRKDKYLEKVNDQVTHLSKLLHILKLYSPISDVEIIFFKKL